MIALPSLVSTLTVWISMSVAQTIYVDATNANCPGTGTAQNPFCLVQDAITAATSGDVIEVAPGTYVETVNLLGKSLTIRGRDGADVTILDGTGGSAPVVAAWSGETVILDGLTIQNGQYLFSGAGVSSIQGNLTITNSTVTGNHSSRFGGGVYSFEGTVSISDSIVSGNYSQTRGGGVYCKGTTTITGSTIDGNSSGYAAGVWSYAGSASVTNSFVTGNTSQSNGGGIEIVSSVASVTECTITGNTATTGRGGGVYSRGVSSLTLSSSTISGNASVHGGGVATFGTDLLEISECLFTANTATQNGGGLDAYAALVTKVDACLFDHNQADSGGGAVFFSGASTVTSSTFADNIANTGGAVRTRFGSCSITNSILWGDSSPEIANQNAMLTVTYSNVQGGQSGTGNISSDPHFLAPGYRDYRIACHSPCVDAGDPSIAVPSHDFEGDDRLVDGDSDGTAVPDMGADEFDMLWVVNQPAQVQYYFTAMAPPAQQGNPAFLFLSLGDGSDIGGLPVPVSGGQRLYLSPDGLFNAWLNFVSSPIGMTTIACPANSTALVPSNPGLTVYYAGFSVDLGTGKIPSVSPTHSYVTQ